MDACLIQSEVALAAVAARLRSATHLAIAVHPCGEDPPWSDAQQLVVKAADGEVVVVVDLTATDGLGALGAVLEQTLVVGHDLRPTLALLNRHGVEPRSVWDTMLAARLLDGGLHLDAAKRGRYFGFDEVARREINESFDATAADLGGAVRRIGTLLDLHARLVERVATDQLAGAMALELDVLPVVVAMTLAGVGVDRARWQALVTSRRDEATLLRGQVESELRIKNVFSQQPLLRALRAVGVAVRRADGDHLAPYTHVPVVERLGRFRRLDSFAAGVGAGVLKALDRSADGRVRARLDQLAAPTGRFGCSEPNLLGVPKADEVRACIVPADGQLFVVADYAAIELRVLAHVTGDERLISVFREGGDPHRLTAATLRGKAIEDVTSAERQAAKAVNFGFAFGMGPEAFVLWAQSQYGVAVMMPEAMATRAAYLEAYPGVARWQEQIRRGAPAAVRSASGRLRSFPDPREGYCERLNTAVQGTAADGLKRAMVLLHPRLQQYRARIVLAVHDELVVEVPREHAEAALALVSTTMIEGMAYYVTSVPIVVEADVRTTWASSSRVLAGDDDGL